MLFEVLLKNLSAAAGMAMMFCCDEGAGAGGGGAAAGTVAVAGSDITVLFYFDFERDWLVLGFARYSTDAQAAVLGRSTGKTCIVCGELRACVGSGCLFSWRKLNSAESCVGFDFSSGRWSS